MSNLWLGLATLALVGFCAEAGREAFGPLPHREQVRNAVGRTWQAIADAAAASLRPGVQPWWSRRLSGHQRARFHTPFPRRKP